MKSISIKSFVILAFILLSYNGFSDNGEHEKSTLHHVLLFKWNADINEETKSEVITLFNGLPTKVDGFEGVDIVDVTTSSEEYDVVLILKFSSSEALTNYEAHPDHQRISTIAPPLIGKFASYDYWK